MTTDARIKVATADLSQKLITYLRAEYNSPDLNYNEPLTHLQGGYETATYRFSLGGLEAERSKPLILRLYPEFYGSANAVWESTVQNVLVAEGYPVARVYHTCPDLAILGGAFFIMEYLPGDLLINTPMENIPATLGKLHASLHQIDPVPLIEQFNQQGIDPSRYSVSGRFDGLTRRAAKLPWIGAAVQWLIAHSPPQPRQLAVCHGDFHPLNILVQNSSVTGVLDWPGFKIADPAYDVANTIVLMTIPSKYIATSMKNMATVNWDLVSERYLDAYQNQRPLDRSNLDYFRVSRCIHALMEGAEGQKVWQHPLIVDDLIGYIYEITGLKINVPQS